MLKFIVAIMISSSLLAAASPSLAKTWRVTSTGSGDAPTIQAGIDSSVAGDTVLVTTGTFTGPGNVDVNFLGKAIVVTSESGASQTIIDCQNAARGFLFVSGEGSGSVLSGLTIANGFTADSGGGIYCDNSSPEIRSNVIANCNATTHGGGVHLKKSDATIVNNTIEGCGAGQRGGGVAVQSQSSPTIHANILCFSTSGAGVDCIGGGTSGALLSCNDLYLNAGGDAVCGTDGGNNFSLEPQFCGVPGTLNYFLQMTSPCAPAQSPCASTIGALPVACTTTPVEPFSWGAVKSRYQ